MTTWLDRRQQKNRAEVHYWSVECWQKFAEKGMPFLCLHQTQMKCGGKARSEIPWLECSEHPGSQQLSTGRCGSIEVQCIWPISFWQQLLRDQTRLLQPQRRTNRPVYSRPWHPKPEAYHFATGSMKARLAVCRPVCISLSALLWMEHRQCYYY